jgi:hypothetical protein
MTCVRQTHWKTYCAGVGGIIIVLRSCGCNNSRIMVNCDKVAKHDQTGP